MANPQLKERLCCDATFESVLYSLKILFAQPPDRACDALRRFV